MEATAPTTVCVYCGASRGTRPSYALGAQALGAERVKRGVALIYGGGSVGLMGEIASTVSATEGSVTGIIPRALQPTEVSGVTPGKVIITEDMHERKSQMASRADAFIALPGGLGTLEELFEIATWRQLGYHQKPIGLLNIDGFYDPLLVFLAHATHEGFMAPQILSNFVVDSDAAQLMDKIIECLG